MEDDAAHGIEREKPRSLPGASRGVGAATAIKLAKAGCKVAINCKQSIDRAGQVAAQCRGLGVKAVVVQGDVASDADCRRITTESVEALGQLDILINNAGTTRFIDFHDLDEVNDDDWETHPRRESEGAVPMHPGGPQVTRIRHGRRDRQHSQCGWHHRHGQFHPLLRVQSWFDQPDTWLGTHAWPKDSRQRGRAGFHRGRMAANRARQQL